MSNHSKFPEFITSYQRILISDWPTMAKLITKHSSLLKEGGYNQTADSIIHVLSEREIQDALQGPYSAFFISKLKAFSLIARLKMAVHIDKEDVLKENFSTLHDELKLDPKKIESISKADVTHIQQSFDELVTAQCQQWEGQLFFWQMSLTGALKTSGIHVTEMEIEELTAPEPLSELLARYDSLSLTPPKFSYPLSFADYFYLKSYLVVLSALSRQHLPHDEKEIEKYMKALKKPLKEIEKAQAVLIKDQENAVQTLLSPISFVKL